MPRHVAADYCNIEPCPNARRREALLHLAAIHEPAYQHALQEALVRAKQTPSFDWQGLLIARREEQIDAALWVEPLGNGTAQLWLPAVQNAASDTLLAAARRWVSTQPIDLCHVTLNYSERDWVALLAANGMREIAILKHMEARCEPCDAPSMTLSLAPFGELSEQQQLALVSEVSQGSLDCPLLLETLSIEELLAGFYGQAPNAPSHWYRALQGDETVGVLLLACQDEHRFELQLMGLCPAWRGQKLGHELVRHAQKVVVQAGARTLLLAVDQYNTPAKRVYEQAGFSVTSQQQLYAWCG